MVKHGKNKKRRAGRTGKTKLKNRTYHRWNPNPKFTDPVIRKHWDPSKSPSVNLAKLGLRSDLNQDVMPGSSNSNNVEQTIANQAKQNLPDDHLIELFDIPDSDLLRQQKASKRCPMNIDDQKYILKGLTKYGQDYSKIFRDTKGVNYMQYTKSQLQKMGARFLLLTPDQRQVENIPESVKCLMHE